MLEYNEIKERKYIVFNGEPYEVISSHVFRKQQRKPVNQTKLKNLITGRSVEHSFGNADKVEEAEISKRSIKYLFNKPNRQTNSTEFWFCEPDDPSERFQLPEELIGDAKKFLKPNEEVTALVFNEKIVGVSIPVKMHLKVVEAEPAVAGNTAQGATKQVTLETGFTITTPLFVKEGDTLEINTQTGEYVKRV